MLLHFRPKTLTTQLGLLALVLSISIHRTIALCGCGYSTIIDGKRHIFRDLLESHFASSSKPYNIKDSTDWQRQAFNLSKDRARGQYGEAFIVENANMAQGGGLDLIVSSTLVDDMVPVAEMDSYRGDLHYGTFRASLKLSSIPGTCAAFFWYFNDTQEIDLEFLTKDFNRSNASYPVNLVLQSRDSAQAHYDASKTGNFLTRYLPFDPTADFHEYRTDYLPDKVLFYADGEVLGVMNTSSAVPTEAGRLILQHWSNGNPLWSGGPPGKDSNMVVRYVKAYFNSSGERANGRVEAVQCPGGDGMVCDIPEITPGNASAGEWFFSDGGDGTDNQTAPESNEGTRKLGGSRSAITVVFIVMGGWMVGAW